MDEISMNTNIISEVSESWSWVGIQPVEIVGENDFGNLVIRDTEGRYWRLCPEEVSCEVIAQNRDELDLLTRDQTFLTDWYMLSLKDQAEEAYGPLQQGHKFHLVLPGVLGGKYDMENVRMITQVEQIRFSGSIGRQIQNVPDGQKVIVKIGD